MERNAYRDDGGGAEQPDAYWRRRVITLALGLGLLGILAWGFSGGGGKPAPASTSGPLPATALGTAIPGLAVGTPSAPPSPSASAPVPASPGSPPGRRPALSPSATLEPTPEASVTAGASSGGRCAAGAVVLSLFTDRSSYGRSQYPRFVVYAVSTSAGSCAFNPGQLEVVVLSAGRIVWDSTDCAHGSGRVAQLARGVPAQDAVVWNHAITLPGCQVLASSARPGTYTVQARTSTVQSPVRTFKLTS